MSLLLPLLLGVAALNVYALALILLRVPLYGTKLLRPMVWNIFLSLVPAFVLAILLGALFLIAMLESRSLFLVTTILGGLLWLLLLPNSAYLITELNFSHRRNDETVPLWYDIVLLLTLALSGLMNTLMNLILAQTLFVLAAFPTGPSPMSRPISWGFVAITLILVSFGIYLGRHLRFNSWDLKQPVQFLRKMTDHFRQPRKLGEAVGFTLAHTVLLAILYLLIIGPVLIQFV